MDGVITESEHFFGETLGEVLGRVHDVVEAVRHVGNRRFAVDPSPSMKREMRPKKRWQMEHSISLERIVPCARIG